MRFQYVFNFRFGAQEVDIEFLRSSSPDYIYIQVGRRSFQQQAVREVPGGKLDAIAIDQLAPTESKQGVIRDALERRHLVVDAGFLQTLFDSFAQEPRGSIEDLGASYGRRLAIDLETDAEESFGVGLRELPIVTLVELIAKLLGRQGWGVLTADLRPARSGVMTFTLGRSALAEAPGSLGGKRCSLTAGILRALLTHVAARPMTVCETRCAAEGGGECTFVATGSGREAQLTNAIASTGGYLSDVLVALARS